MLHDASAHCYDREFQAELFQGHLESFQGQLERFRGQLEGFHGQPRFRGHLENCRVNVQHLGEKCARCRQWAGISGPGTEENGNVCPKEAVLVNG